MEAPDASRTWAGCSLYLCVVEPPCTEGIVRKLLDIGPKGGARGREGGDFSRLSQKEQGVVHRTPAIEIGPLDYVEAATCDTLESVPEPVEAVADLFETSPLAVIDEALIAVVVEALATRNFSPYQPAPTEEVVAFLKRHLGKKAFAAIW